MKIELYVNNELLDFNDPVNIKNRIYDIFDEEIGATLKTYTLEIPWTDNNKKVLSFPNIASSIQTETLTAKLFINGICVISGNFRNLSYSRNSGKYIIEGIDWAKSLLGLYIDDDIYSAYDYHTFNGTNIEASWSAAAGALYRYPYLNSGFSRKMTAIGSYTGETAPEYFMPMWSIFQIMTRIFDYAKIKLDADNWFASTTGKKMYALFPYKLIKDDSYIEGKDVEMRVANAADNQATNYFNSHQTETMTLNKDYIDFDSTISNDNGYWDTTNDRYNIPENGTYRFKASICVDCDIEGDSDFSISSRSITATMYYYDIDAKLVTVAEFTRTSGFTFGTILGSLDSGYIYCQKNGFIRIKIVASITAYNNTLFGETKAIYTANNSSTMNFTCIMDEMCIHPGEGAILYPRDYMPHITVFDFLKAVKKAFGLIFWYDTLNRQLYVRTYNDFFGSTVIDLTGIQDNGFGEELKVIAADYAKTIQLKYKSDSDDWVYKNEFAQNGEPCDKTVTLTNINAKIETAIHENSVFASTPKYADYGHYNHATIQVISIYGDSDNVVAGNAGYYYTSYRPKTFMPRLLEWFGDVSPTSPETISWKWYDTWNDASPTTKTTYPKAETPSMESNYLLFSKRYFMIDNKKALEIEIIMTPTMFLEFQTVLNSAADEGFRAVYKFTINKVEGLFYIQSIVYNGNRARLELIQR
jgi:hypothetical protein